VVYTFSRIFYKVIKVTCGVFTFLQDYSLARTSFLLLNKASRQKADLYIAHTLGALPAASKAAIKRNVPFGFDAEDYHSGESTTPSMQRTINLQNKYFPKLSYLTAASPLIAEAYHQLFPQLTPVIINNVFSKRYLLSKFPPYKKGDVLKLFWFSQTIGRERGIEDIIIAIGKSGSEKIQCTLLGDCSDELRSYLLQLAEHNNLKTGQIIFSYPVEPDHIFSIASEHHIGLATETGKDENNKRALSNKIFTYLLSGMAVVASNTPAQEKFMKEYAGIGKVYNTGDTEQLGDIFLSFLNNDHELNNCRSTSIDLASDKLNWENESGKFLSVVQSVIDQKRSSVN
jgi:glycosyltransferase involved in cell wall biosynthesis